MNNNTTDWAITTKRLKIRKLHPKDITDYYEIFANPVICRFDDFVPITLEEASNWIPCAIDNYSNPENEQELAVEESASGKLIGILFLNPKADPASIGYHFNETYHGMGYASEALAAWVASLKTTRQPLFLKALVHPDNKASKRVLEKLGFEYHSTHFMPETGAPEEVYLLK